eukprot:TRINITY_DN15555_c0_g1_i2.p1 TRINITY_DN15555_c0_g1~~TRINITY_DN15555_c0_g1_i2.p1  ORF type:complete len:439 (-),score=133.51 TRINITY_DN15555_c0_g1_i2:102-1418(-)
MKFIAVLDSAQALISAGGSSAKVESRSEVKEEVKTKPVYERLYTPKVDSKRPATVIKSSRNPPSYAKKVSEAEDAKKNSTKEHKKEGRKEWKKEGRKEEKKEIKKRHAEKDTKKSTVKKVDKPEVKRKAPVSNEEKKGAIAKYSSELREIIENSVLKEANIVKWEELVGLEDLKKKMQECIVLPIRNPKLFSGLLAPSKGILMFGPPGNGKTMVAKAVASQFNGEVTFFNLSAGELTSRYYGDSEKLVKALFEVAAERQPSVIFIDEIDSILGARKSSELDVSRRLKTEFLVRFDGVGTNAQDRILVVGATNRPFDLDDAVLRRFTSRIFLPLPSLEARKQMLVKQLQTARNNLTEKEITTIAQKTEGYSFADLRSLCTEAAMGPMRSFGMSTLVVMDKEQAPSISMPDFNEALKKIVKSVSKKSMEEFEMWNKLNKS